MTRAANVFVISFAIVSSASAQTLFRGDPVPDNRASVRGMVGTAKLMFAVPPVASIDSDEAVVLVSVQATTPDARHSLPGFPVVLEARAASVVATADALTDRSGFARISVRMPLPPSHLLVFVRAYGRYDPLSSTGEFGVILRRIGVDLETQIYALSNGLVSSLASRAEPIELALGMIVTPRLSVALASHEAHDVSMSAELPVIVITRAPVWVPEGWSSPSAGSTRGPGDLRVGIQYRWADLATTRLSFNAPLSRAIDRAPVRLDYTRTFEAADGFRRIDTGAALVLPVGRSQFFLDTSRSVAWSRIVKGAIERAEPSFHVSIGVGWMDPEKQSRVILFGGYVKLGGTRFDRSGTSGESPRSRVIDRMVGVSWERSGNARVQSTVTAFVGGLGGAPYVGATYGVTIIAF